MKRLLGAAVGLTLTFSALLLTFIAVGRTQPPPDFALLFTDADGKPCQPPCMFGIRVGETTMIEAKRILSSHPLTRHLYQDTVTGDIQLKGINIDIGIFQAQDGVVGGIFLLYRMNQDYLEQMGSSTELFSPIETNLGDIINTLAIPNFAEPFVGPSGYSKFYYQYEKTCLEVETGHNLNRITKDSYFMDMSISANVSCVRGHEPAQWLGFTTPERYKTIPSEP